jgi:hypothetical protein
VSETVPAKKKTSLPADAQLDRLIHDSSPEILVAVAADLRLTEDLALALLNRRDLPPDALQELYRNAAVAKLPKVRLALVAHPRTPRHVSVPLMRGLHTFELMQIALQPAVSASVWPSRHPGAWPRLCSRTKKNALCRRRSSTRR